MKPERWDEIDQVWHAVLSRPEQERAAALLELSAGDETLRRDVESMLAHLARASAAGFGAAGAAVKLEQRGALIGRQLGPYSIGALLGAGGMGEVYQAHDETLRRDVAIKILPALWTADAERLARFDREAQLLASLNHENIGAIYGVHESDGVRALVLELVEGETLSERIARHSEPSGPHGLPIHEVVDIAAQIAEALEASHERGVIHRDLKPANIKITPGGRVKVLDFGLARAMSHSESGTESSQAHNATIGGVRDGLLLGTPQYMSPEQAKGRQVDRRSDIWAFGCVLYEMLTGVPAFGGDGIAEILASVIKGEPDWNALPADTPQALRVCMYRCLQKELRERIHDMADVRLAMEGAFESSTQGFDALRRVGPRRGRIAYIGWALAGIFAATTGIAILVSFRRAPEAVQSASVQAVMPPAQEAISSAQVATASPPAASPPVQEATPPVLVNPRLGGGGGAASVRTIQEAIDLVAPGGTVTVLPGTYAETLTITKGMTIEATAERTGPVVIAPPGSPESVIEVATTEPVILRGLTVHVPGANGIRGLGGVNLTVQRATVLAVNPPITPGSLILVRNDAGASGLRARAVIRESSIDGAVTQMVRFEARPQIVALRLSGDVDGVIERNIIRRTGAICVMVVTRDDLGGTTNVDILNNDIDECHPVARVGAVVVGTPSIDLLSPERPITATGVINIIGNTIRNSTEDCLNNAIAWNVYSGRIERNTIVDFVKPCATMTSRNRPGAIWIGLQVTGISLPLSVPSIRFNDIHGNARAGLRIGPDQTVPIDSSCNYWGTERGPSGIGPGDGDAILIESQLATPMFLPFARVPVAKSKSPQC